MDEQTNSAWLGGTSTSIKKRVNVQEVENGYVVNLGYNGTKIASNKEEVLNFISEYIDSK